MNSQKRVKIAPSILSADLAHLGEQVQQAEEGGADCIHIDVMDGRFVPNITFGAIVVKAVRKVTTLPLYTHLMIMEPERHIASFVDAGSDVVEVHVETCPHLHRTIQQIKGLGARAGVALNPSTPISQLDEIVEYVDSVLMMTVDPGFSGQQFIGSMFRKIRQVRAMLDERGLTAELGVDGGIDAQTAPLVTAEGATVLVAGQAVFGTQGTVGDAISALRRSAGY